jgi:hypothetical protein
MIVFFIETEGCTVLCQFMSELNNVGFCFTFKYVDFIFFPESTIFILFKNTNKKVEIQQRWREVITGSGL